MSQENPWRSSLSEAKWPENLLSVGGWVVGGCWYQARLHGTENRGASVSEQEKTCTQVKQKEQIFPHLFFRPMLCSMLDLSSPTRDQTCAPCIGRMES